jgi:protein-S-isoprenylcysteine O-methyltransferase Ste14
VLRSRYEEQLLAKVFPEYRDYASRTRRLIPLVW